MAMWRAITRSAQSVFFGGHKTKFAHSLSTLGIREAPGITRRPIFLGGAETERLVRGMANHFSSVPHGERTDWMRRFAPAHLAGRETAAQRWISLASQATHRPQPPRKQSRPMLPSKLLPRPRSAAFMGSPLIARKRARAEISPKGEPPLGQPHPPKYLGKRGRGSPTQPPVPVSVPKRPRSPSPPQPLRPRKVPKHGRGNPEEPAL